MKRLKTGMVGALAALLLAAAGPSAAAAQADPTPPDEAELRTFTEAYVGIAEVREDMSPELAAAQTPEEATQIQEEANDRMMLILDEHGLDVERYSEITAMLNADEELRAEFEAIYAELVSG